MLHKIALHVELNASYTAIKRNDPFSHCLLLLAMQNIGKLISQLKIYSDFIVPL